MTANDLYNELIVQGFCLSVNGASLTISPSSQLTDDLRAQIRLYKAELMALVATNDHYESFVVNEVSTNGGNLKPTTENATSEICPKLDTSTHYPKSAVENHDTLFCIESYPQTEDGQHSPTVEVTPTWSMDRYAHLVTCQNCQHLSIVGECKAKIGYKPMTNARRNCNQHQSLREARPAVADASYTSDELTALLWSYKGELLNHLAYCPNCRTNDRRWCAEGIVVSSAYEALLLCFEDDDVRKVEVLN